MTTGITIGVFSVAAFCIAVAAMAFARIFLPSQAPKTAGAPLSIAEPDDLSLPQPMYSERNPGPEPSLSLEDGLASAAYEPSKHTTPLAMARDDTYDPDLENEDDVPTTLFRDGEAEEIEAFVADLESENSKR